MGDRAIFQMRAYTFQESDTHGTAAVRVRPARGPRPHVDRRGTGTLARGQSLCGPDALREHDPVAGGRPGSGLTGQLVRDRSAVAGAREARCHLRRRRGRPADRSRPPAAWLAAPDGPCGRPAGRHFRRGRGPVARGHDGEPALHPALASHRRAARRGSRRDRRAAALRHRPRPLYLRRWHGAPGHDADDHRAGPRPPGGKGCRRLVHPDRDPPVRCAAA